MIDFIILTNTRSEKDYNMANGLIESIVRSDYPSVGEFSGYRITLVENNTSCGGFVYPDICDIAYFDMQKYGMFNYNYALNIGMSRCLDKHNDTDWFCVLNNDVVCQPDWILRIQDAVQANPQIQSVCPNIREKQDGVVYGYTLFQHLDGCCIMYRKSILDKIQIWDEAFDFAYQDDDYLETIRNAGIVHVKVLSSKISHIGGATVNYTTELAMRGLRTFVRKWSMPVFQMREHAKHAFLDKLKEP